LKSRVRAEIKKVLDLSAEYAIHWTANCLANLDFSVSQKELRAYGEQNFQKNPGEDRPESQLS
jgi:hypothetical protein